MSIVYLVHHDENVYNYEEKKEVNTERPPRHHSMFEKSVRIEHQAAKDRHRTMGYALVPLHAPNEFLTKGCGVRVPVQKPDHTCDKKKRKADLPRKKDLQTCPTNRRNGENFKKKNIDIVCSAKPRRPDPRFADTRNGDCHELAKSGLMPCYVYDTKFGKLPPYLVKRIRDADRCAEQTRDEAKRKQPLCQYITQEERADVLRGLKANWEQLQKQYQSISVLTDTISKIIRKTKLENSLTLLEKDILQIESHPYICITGN